MLTETALHCVFTPPDGSLTSDPPLSAGGTTMDSPFGFEAIPACWKFSVLTAQGFDDRTPCEGRSKDRQPQWAEVTFDGVQTQARSQGCKGQLKIEEWAERKDFSMVKQATIVVGVEAACGANILTSLSPSPCTSSSCLPWTEPS